MLWNTLNLNRKTMPQEINPQGTLFDMAETVDGCYKHLVNRTCRQCANRQAWNNDTARNVQICTARRSARTASGYARCRIDQPACVLFELKQNTKAL